MMSILKKRLKKLLLLRVLLLSSHAAFAMNQDDDGHRTSRPPKTINCGMTFVLTDDMAKDISLLVSNQKTHRLFDQNNSYRRLEIRVACYTIENCTEGDHLILLKLLKELNSKYPEGKNLTFFLTNEFSHLSFRAGHYIEKSGQVRIVLECEALSFDLASKFKDRFGKLKEDKKLKERCLTDNELRVLNNAKLNPYDEDHKFRICGLMIVGMESTNQRGKETAQHIQKAMQNYKITMSGALHWGLTSFYSYSYMSQILSEYWPSSEESATATQHQKICCFSRFKCLSYEDEEKTI